MIYGQINTKRKDGEKFYFGNECSMDLLFSLYNICLALSNFRIKLSSCVMSIKF